MSGPAVWLAFLVALSTCTLFAEVPRLINVQFGVDNSPTKIGPAATGLSSTDYWNRYSRDMPGGGYSADGNLSALRWSDNTASGVGMRVQNAPGAFGNGHSDPMFGTYLYPFNSEPIVITITNLPAGKYNVVAYGHGGPPNQQNTEFELRSGTVSYGTGKTTQTGDWLGTEWIEGSQYVQFSEVHVDPESPLILISRGDGISTAFINGLQIISRPQPQESVMNITFGAATSRKKVGPAAVGQGSADYWNIYSRDSESGGYKSFGGLSNLAWADGRTSSIGLTIDNAPGAWGNGHSDPMFADYLYPLGGGPNITVTITNLPTGRYSFYCYAHGGPPDAQNAAVSLSSAGIDYGELTTTSSPGWLSTTWQEGVQYVLFKGVVAFPDDAVVLLVNPGTAGVSMINGLQIVRENSPTLMFHPTGRLFTNSVSVSIIATEPGVQVRYTLDGSAPTESSPLWDGPLTLSKMTTIKALGFRGGATVGEVESATYSRVYALNDGISAEWRARYFGPDFLTDPRVAPYEDPDGDGADNLREYVAGTDPLDAFSGFSVSVRSVPAISWRSIPGKTYRIMRRQNLSEGEWELFRQVTADADTSRLVDADADRTWFYAIEPVR